MSRNADEIGQAVVSAGLDFMAPNYLNQPSKNHTVTMHKPCS